MFKHFNLMNYKMEYGFLLFNVLSILCDVLSIIIFFPFIISLNPPTQEEPVDVKSNVASEKERSVLEEVLSLHDDGSLIRAEEPSSTIAPDIAEALSTLDIIKEPSVPPVHVHVEDLSTALRASNPSLGDSISLQDELARSETPLEVHIVSTKKSLLKLHMLILVSRALF